MPQEPVPPSARQMNRSAAQAEEPTNSAARGYGQLILIGALVGIVCAGGVALFLIFGSQSGTASVAAQHFCDVLVAHDYATAYADLSQALQQEGTEEQFAASQHLLDTLRGPATACTFSNANVRGSHATFILRVTRARTGAASGTLQLVSETEGWKVASYDANVI
ncbi:MAG TPA: hypothetical protein VF916_08095 [Ktedonobacterales bacterium]|jgi:predicted membrane metal-binding protein